MNTPEQAVDDGENRPAADGSPKRGRDYLLILAAALILYVCTAAPSVLWQDNGLAQIRVLQHDLVGRLGLALSHPLYYLAAFGFQYLPFEDSAFKTNLVSAVFGAFTVANVYLLILLMTRSRIGAAIGALSLMVAHTFWQHCAMAEVYSLSTALMTVELLCLHRFCETGKTRWLVLFFFANGLGISNHMLAGLSTAIYGCFVAWGLWGRKIKVGHLAPIVLIWLVGASIYLWLIAGAIADGQSAGEAIHSALFGNSYAKGVLNAFPSVKQIKNSVLYLGLNFPTPAVLLIIPGLAAVWRLRRKAFGMTLFGLLAIHLAWAVRYDVPDQYTFFIPAIMLLTIVLGTGASVFLERRGRAWRWAVACAASVPALVYVAAPSMARAAGVSLGTSREVPYRDGYTYFLRPWKTGYHGPERFAEELRKTLPANAVLIADGTTSRPIYYALLTKGWRDDVLVYPPLRKSADDEARFGEAELSAALDAGLVYVVTPKPTYCPDWLLEKYSFEQAGIIYRVAGRATDVNP